MTLLAVPRVPRFCYYCDLLLKYFVFYLCHFFCYHCDLLLNSLTVTRNLFVNLFKKNYIPCLGLIFMVTDFIVLLCDHSYHNIRAG